MAHKLYTQAEILVSQKIKLIRPLLARLSRKELVSLLLKFLPAKYLSELFPILCKLGLENCHMHSEGKAQQLHKGKRKYISSSLRTADRKVPLNWNTGSHLMFLCPFLAPNAFCSLFNFFKLLNMSDTWNPFCIQRNAKKRHWYQRKSSYVLKFIWEICSTFSKSRKQKGVLWSLRGALPSWQLQAGCAESCPKGLCSCTRSHGRTIRDLNSCYNLCPYSFLLFI